MKVRRRNQHAGHEWLEDHSPQQPFAQSYVERPHAALQQVVDVVELILELANGAVQLVASVHVDCRPRGEVLDERNLLNEPCRQCREERTLQGEGRGLATRTQREQGGAG